MRKIYFYKTYNQGSIALYLVGIISILLVTATSVGVRLAVSEMRQASEVDQSDAAYYAAEAGIEEASRRLDVNDNTLDLEYIFPEQFDGDAHHGDRAVLIDGDGESSLGALNIVSDVFSQHNDRFGRLTWRQRRVYEEERPPSGSQVKDESIELDASEIRQRCGTDSIAGEDGFDCFGNDIYDTFGGVEYCWNNRSPGPTSEHLELTALSYPAGDASNVVTEKVLLDSVMSSTVSLGHIAVGPGGSSDQYDNCRDITISSDSSARRFIFRIRPLFPSAVLDGPYQMSDYSIDYRTRILQGSTADYNPDRPMFFPDDTVLIDAVGRSGDTRRRIVARKERQGRILGIFDYVVYSGDPNIPLCRAGVEQSDVGYSEQCLVDSDLDN